VDNLPNTRTIYVNAASGNDTTGDGSAAKPYKTSTKALAAANASIASNITIRLAAGTYLEHIQIYDKRVTITGASTDPSQTVIKDPDGSLWYVVRVYGNTSHLYLQNVTVEGTAGTPAAAVIALVLAADAGAIYLTNCNIKSTAASASGTGATRGTSSETGACITMSEVRFKAGIYTSLLYATRGTICANGPNYSEAVTVVYKAYALYNGDIGCYNTWTDEGQCTGSLYNASTNSRIAGIANMGAATAAGITSSGGMAN
jgi:hypothetical protein